MVTRFLQPIAAIVRLGWAAVSGLARLFRRVIRPDTAPRICVTSDTFILRGAGPWMMSSGESDCRVARY
jgi:hypothetical protein